MNTFETFLGNTSRFLALALILGTTSCSLFSTRNELSLARRAEQAQEAGNCEKAINLYNKHIEDRITQENKAEKENPWFYLIKIGDCQFEQNKETEALNTYLEAKSKKVYPDLIADRIMKVVDMRVKQKRYDDAINLLKDHREIDELKFDSRIDEIHKEIVVNEEFPIIPAQPINQ